MDKVGDIWYKVEMGEDNKFILKVYEITNINGNWIYFNDHGPIHSSYLWSMGYRETPKEAIKFYDEEMEDEYKCIKDEIEKYEHWKNHGEDDLQLAYLSF